MFVLLYVCAGMCVLLYLYLLWAVKVTSVEKRMNEIGHTACFYWHFLSIPAATAISVMDFACDYAIKISYT